LLGHIRPRVKGRPPYHSPAPAANRARHAAPNSKPKLTKVFWFFFSKKNRLKHFFLKKEAKTFVHGLLARSVLVDNNAG
jgi:hypothetical protein